MECPLCQASARSVEQLSRGFFCNVCAQAFELDAAGQVTRRTPTNHTPRDVRDVSGNVMYGEK
jgi:hypothetical protein